MELINPIGRNMNSPIQPLACYCASNGGRANVNFATGKGPSDTCSNCGCYCDSVIGIGYNTGSYREIASITDRTSSL